MISDSFQEMKFLAVSLIICSLSSRRMLLELEPFWGASSCDELWLEVIGDWLDEDALPPPLRWFLGMPLFFTDAFEETLYVCFSQTYFWLHLCFSQTCFEDCTSVFHRRIQWSLRQPHLFSDVCMTSGDFVDEDQRCFRLITSWNEGVREQSARTGVQANRISAINEQFENLLIKNENQRCVSGAWVCGQYLPQMSNLRIESNFRN